MAFYNKKEQLYLETNVLGVSSGVHLLKMRDIIWFLRNEASDNAVLWPITFASKSLTSTENCYKKIERKVLGMLHDHKKFHHYCFAHEVSVITD